MNLFFWRHLKMGPLSRMLDGMLLPAEERNCRKHLAACGSCQNLLEGLRKARGVLKQMPTEERHPLEQLQPPLFIPVIGPAVPSRIFILGLLLGTLAVGITLFHPIEVPMRVVSAPSAQGMEELKNLKLEPGVPLKSMLPGDVDLEIPGELLLRLRPGATMTWQQLSRPLIFGGRPKIILNVMQGEILARTEDKFRRSNLEVRTPTANALVRGTAFSISVDSEKGSATSLKVLAGSVFFSPYLNRVGVKVNAGQTSSIGGRGIPSRPEELSPKQREALLEAYRIGQPPLALLVIGAGPERVKELLTPALLYLGLQDHPELHFFIRRLVANVNAGILDGGLPSRVTSLKGLEIALSDLRDAKLAVPLRLFVGACQLRLGYRLEGRAHFRWVVANAPGHPLASLALGALGFSAEKELRNPELAQAAFQQTLSQYPSSPEAELAREFLSRYVDPR